MSRKTLDHGTPEMGGGRRTLGRWLALLLGMSLVWAGCGRSTEPARHEVHKPISPASADQPLEIVYPDIPSVPEQIEGPSPPVE